MVLSGGLRLKVLVGRRWRGHHFLYLMGAPLRELLILGIRLYQRAVSPFLGPRCRFVPSCSEYVIECLKKKGLVVGLAKGVWRIVRCNPFCPGGYDPVE